LACYTADVFECIAILREDSTKESVTTTFIHALMITTNEEGMSQRIHMCTIDVQDWNAAGKTFYLN